MYKTYIMNSSTITREEERKARARAANARHIANVQKQKEWLAANPHIISQQEREKEERRKNFETIRILAMNAETEKKTQKKKKPVNAFAALCESDTDEEQEDKQDYKQEDKQESVPIETKEKMPVFNTKRFIWADEDE
jgi:hypothetical protein